jgi:hypothetical protein
MFPLKSLPHHNPVDVPCARGHGGLAIADIAENGIVLIDGNQEPIT